MMSRDAFEDAAREIAKTMSAVREEAMDRLRTDIEREVEKMEAEGFDPARGRGRGPRWMNGG